MDKIIMTLWVAFILSGCSGLKGGSCKPEACVVNVDQVSHTCGGKFSKK